MADVGGWWGRWWGIWLRWCKLRAFRFLFRGHLLRKDWTLHSLLVLWVSFRFGAPSRGYELGLQVLKRIPPLKLKNKSML